MTDEPNEPEKAAIPPSAPWPEPYTIPHALLQQWGQIPPDELLTIPLARQDIDHLLTGLLRLADGQVFQDRALVEWSNGRIEEANRAIGDFRRTNLEAQNSIRQFVASVMATVAMGRRRD
ncbi:hypothetical protein [Bradyrhizobium sp. HKCCYLR1023]|uniref:hypothetical protein n=1 Tax=Bradyrhizobium TaxID=374 RepID=UPI003EBBE98B